MWPAGSCSRLRRVDSHRFTLRISGKGITAGTWKAWTCDSGCLLMEGTGKGPCVWEVLANQDEQSNMYVAHIPLRNPNHEFFVHAVTFFLWAFYFHTHWFFALAISVQVSWVCYYFGQLVAVAGYLFPAEKLQNNSTKHFNLFPATCSVIPLSDSLKFQNSMPVKRCPFLSTQHWKTYNSSDMFADASFHCDREAGDKWYSKEFLSIVPSVS